MEELNFNVEATLSLSDCKIILASLRNQSQQMETILGKENYELLSDVPGLILYFRKLVGEIIE